MNPSISKSGTDRLNILFANGNEQQWSIMSDIDWTQDIIQPNWLLRRFYGALVSQFRYGELATIRVCQQLLNHVREPAARRLLEQQIMDEQRHAQVYERYMVRLGDEAQPDASMVEVVERALQWQGSPLGLVVAFQIMLEGEALRSLQDLAKEIRCPLFGQINACIQRDEARHVAFGKVYLKEHLKTLDHEQRIAIYRFVKSMWDDSTAGMLSGFRISGFVTQTLRRRWVAEGWALHSRTLVDIGLLDDDDLVRV